MKTVLLATISFFTVGVNCWGQKTASTKAGVTVLLAKLHSTEESEREEAFEQLLSDPANLKSPAVQAALLELLDRERQKLDSDLLEAQKKGYPDEGDNSEWGEYYSDLLGVVDSFANWNDPRQACILVDANPSDDSDFAAEIADHAKVTVPCLITRSNSAVSMIRAVAVPVLVQALTKASDTPDAKTIQTAKNIISAALQDSSDGVPQKRMDIQSESKQLTRLPRLRNAVIRDVSAKFTRRAEMRVVVPIKHSTIRRRAVRRAQASP